LDENSETGRDGIGKLKTVGDMEHQMTLRELSGALERAIDELPNQQRGVFVLCDVERLSTAEAAQVTGFGIVALACDSSRQIEHVKFVLGMAQQTREVPESFSVF